LDRILCHAQGARDSLADVGDDSLAPTANFVPEETEASDEFRSDRSLRDHTSPFTVTIGDRGLLDHEAALRDHHHESRVIKVVWTSSLNPGAYRFEETSAQPHDVLARAQRYPVEIHGSGRLETFVRGSAFPAHPLIEP
jgi:hypothetical protein